ncbi:MAG TPA: zf-HC2 domain-containing protein [Kofleriaceae bacterium]|nr:zf-HC2 domain-containing protein [Kofleriaceae bacterium]
MDHEEASMAGATEKYLLGTLDEDQRDAFEEHFFDCEECAEDIRAAAAVAAGASALPNEHVVSLSERRVAAEARRRPVPSRRGLVAGLASMAAALVCLVGYQNLAVIPRMQAELRTAESIQPVSSHFLSLSRSEAPAVVLVGPADRHAALTLSRSWDRSFPAYRCELQDESGRVLLAQTLAARSAADELEVLLPVGVLPAGSYVLVVEGVEGAEEAAAARGSSASAPEARYSFKLERR